MIIPNTVRLWGNLALPYLVRVVDVAVGLHHAARLRGNVASIMSTTFKHPGISIGDRENQGPIALIPTTANATTNDGGDPHRFITTYLN